MTGKQKQPIENIAFVDGQNLHRGTQMEDWRIDYAKFRVYLKEKYKVKIAYYFLGYLDEEQQNLYSKLQESGFVILFKEHHKISNSPKKGNVDTDMVFEMMKSLIEKDFNKIVLVSGDGDYKKVVDYLVSKNRFEKILFPNKNFASSLYKKLGNQFRAFLSDAKTNINKEKGG